MADRARLDRRYCRGLTTRGDMKASLFVEELQNLIEHHGDIEVEDDNGRAVDVEYWNEDGEECFLVS